MGKDSKFLFPYPSFYMYVYFLMTTPPLSIRYKILFCTAYSTWILGLPFLWTEGQHWAVPWGYLTSTSRWCPSPQDVGPESPLRTPQPSPPSVLRNKISQMFLKNTNKCTSFIAKISTFTETVKSCTLLKMVTIILGFVFFCFFLQKIFFNIQNLRTFLDEEQQPSDTYLAFCYSSYNSHKCVNHFLICWRIMLEVKNNFLSKVQQCSRESESLYQTTWVAV